MGSTGVSRSSADHSISISAHGAGRTPDTTASRDHHDPGPPWSECLSGLDACRSSRGWLGFVKPLGFVEDDGLEFAQLWSVFTPVVSAEDQFAAGSHRYPHIGLCATPIAAVNCGQWLGGQGRGAGHGYLGFFSSAV